MQYIIQLYTLAFHLTLGANVTLIEKVKSLW